MTREVLKATYYRAITDRDLQWELHQIWYDNQIKMCEETKQIITGVIPGYSREDLEIFIRKLVE